MTDDIYLSLIAEEEQSKKEPKSIAKWCKEIHESAEKHGWWEGGERSVAEQLLNIVSELTDAREQYLLGKDITEVWFSDCEREETTKKPEGFGIELADCIIRLFDTLAHMYGADRVEDLIRIKHNFNQRVYEQEDRNAAAD